MRRFSVLVALLFAVGCASGPSTAAPPPAEKSTGYSAQAGSEAVGVIPAAALHDPQRNKDVDLSIEYPIKGGPFPLIIFSHGYGSSEQGYEQLASYWSSHGYVVVRPKHADARQPGDAMRAIYGERTNEDRSRHQRGNARAEAGQVAAARDESERREMARIWETQREPQWRDRVRDVTLIIDRLDELEQRFPELKGKIDHAKIGVGGHSLGAMTAMLVGGAKTFGNPPLSLADPRVKAIVVMSPQGVTASLGLNPQSFADIHVPAVFMTGTEDRGAAPNEDWQWRKTAFTNAPAGDKYFVLLQGARHSTFAGTYAPVEIPQTTSIPRQTAPQPYPPGDPRNPNPIYDTPQPSRSPTNPQVGRGLFNEIRVIALRFWDAYLKGDAKGREFLDKTAPTLGGVTIEKK
jgi:predicted dienelactone hydrolase